MYTIITVNGEYFQVELSKKDVEAILIGCNPINIIYNEKTTFFAFPGNIRCYVEVELMRSMALVHEFSLTHKYFHDLNECVNYLKYIKADFCFGIEYGNDYVNVNEYTFQKIERILSCDLVLLIKGE